MRDLLTALECHDPDCKISAAEVTTAFTALSGTVPAAAKVHLKYARQAMIAHLAEPSELLLNIARAEMLKAEWAS